MKSSHLHLLRRGNDTRSATQERPHNFSCIFTVRVGNPETLKAGRFAKSGSLLTVWRRDCDGETVESVCGTCVAAPRR